MSTAANCSGLLRKLSALERPVGSPQPNLTRIEAFLRAEARWGNVSLLGQVARSGPFRSNARTPCMLSNFQDGLRALIQIFLLGRPSP